MPSPAGAKQTLSFSMCLLIAAAMEEVCWGSTKREVICGVGAQLGTEDPRWSFGVKTSLNACHRMNESKQHWVFDKKHKAQKFRFCRILPHLKAFALLIHWKCLMYIAVDLCVIFLTAVLGCHKAEAIAVEYNVSQEENVWKSFK